MCRIWLTPYPKSEAGKDLKKIIHLLHKIESEADSLYWNRLFRQWYTTYKVYIEEYVIDAQTGRKWRKHKLLYRCYSVIKKAQPHMFQYLKNENIPKTTNGIESFFGHLKDNLSLHRGLTIEHRNNFIKWYLYYKNADAR